jgi:hypothetical protein
LRFSGNLFKKVIIKNYCNKYFKYMREVFMKGILKNNKGFTINLFLLTILLIGLTACPIINPPTTPEPTPEPTPIPGGDEYEPDDTCGQANTIAEGVLQHHTFHDFGDIDYMIFYAFTGDRYTIETFSPVDDTDTVLFLFDTDGITLLAYNDDNDDYRNLPESPHPHKDKEDKNTRSLQSTIVWQCPADGAYYLCVVEYSGYTGSYDILLESPDYTQLLMIQDFESEEVTPEGAAPVNVWGQFDYTYCYNGDENDNGTNGMVNEITAFSITTNGAGVTTRSATIAYNIGDNDTIEYEGPAIAGYGTLPGFPVDLSDSAGISFYAKGTGIFFLIVGVRTTEQIAIFEDNAYVATVAISDTWQQFFIPWENLIAADWGFNIPPIDPSQVELINLTVEEPSGTQTAGEFSFDEIATYVY